MIKLDFEDEIHERLIWTEEAAMFDYRLRAKQGVICEELISVIYIFCYPFV